MKSNFAGTITQVRGNAWKTAWNFTRKVYPIRADQILWEIREEFDASDPMFDLETDDGRAALWSALTNLMLEHCAANPKGMGCYDLIVGFISDRPKTFPNGTLQGYTYGRPTNISSPPMKTCRPQSPMKSDIFTALATPTMAAP